MTSRDFDPYAILSVARGAEPAEIKEAHRRHIKNTHPDAGGDRAEFERIQLAYEILIDPEKRAEYDRDGRIPGASDLNGVDHGALNMIGALMMQILAKDNEPFEHDLVEVMTASLKEDAKQVATAMAKLERTLKRIKRMRRRFRKRGDGRNIFEGILDYQERAIADAFKNQETMASYRARAIEMLADYDFEKDGPLSGFLQPRVGAFVRLTTSAT